MELDERCSKFESVGRTKAVVGTFDIGCVGSVAMICVLGFDFVVAGSVSSVDSVVMG